MKSLNELNVDVILGERLDLDSIPSKVDSYKTYDLSYRNRA